jgi:hypothetical protein
LLIAGVKLVVGSLKGLPTALDTVGCLILIRYFGHEVLANTFPESIGGLVGGVQWVLSNVKPRLANLEILVCLVIGST